MGGQLDAEGSWERAQPLYAQPPYMDRGHLSIPSFAHKAGAGENPIYGENLDYRPGPHILDRAWPSPSSSSVGRLLGESDLPSSIYYGRDMTDD